MVVSLSRSIGIESGFTSRRTPLEMYTQQLIAFSSVKSHQRTNICIGHLNKTGPLCKQARERRRGDLGVQTCAFVIQAENGEVQVTESRRIRTLPFYPYAWGYAGDGTTGIKSR